MKITGTIFSYYFMCKRKCYLHASHLQCEDNSELVKIGKYLHEERQYNSNSTNSELLIDNIKIDSIEGNYVVEYKKRNSTLTSTKMQLLFYLYTLEQKGVYKRGIIKFKENREDIHLELNKEQIVHIKSKLIEIENFLNTLAIPKPIKKGICSKCAYYDFCYS